MNKPALLILFVLLAHLRGPFGNAWASDHDDGETDTKARAVNLTDHYVFRENAIAGVSPSNSNLIFIQSSNPRSLPQQQYFFSSNAHYEIHVSRVADADKTKVPTGSDDIIFRFMFGSPDSKNTQSVTFWVLNGSSVVGSATGATTNLENSRAGSLTNNTVSVGGQTYTFFAGHREDTFVFDATRFFQVRGWLYDLFVNGNASAALANDCTGSSLTSASHLFNPSSCAPDFTKNYNVNSIVLRVPIAALQTNNETTFDTWSTISIPL